jgi:3-oxoacyl-(acyl-carrier-protein) synthase
MMAYDRIVSGPSWILAGSTSDSGPYIWGGFDAMRVSLNIMICLKKAQDHSASASGFVPGSGAGAVVLEDLETNSKRC